MNDLERTFYHVTVHNEPEFAVGDSLVAIAIMPPGTDLYQARGRLDEFALAVGSYALLHETYWTESGPTTRMIRSKKVSRDDRVSVTGRLESVTYIANHE